MFPVRSTLLVTSLLLVACATDPSEGCTATTEARVGSGLTPTIDWSPRCGVNGVHVFVAVPETAPPAPEGGVIVGPPMWGIQARDAEHNPILPSLRYGVMPRNAVTTDELQPLVHGTEYVLLLRAVEAGGSGRAVGFLKFTP